MLTPVQRVVLDLLRSLSGVEGAPSFDVATLTRHASRHVRAHVVASPTRLGAILRDLSTRGLVASTRKGWYVTQTGRDVLDGTVIDCGDLGLWRVRTHDA